MTTDVTRAEVADAARALGRAGLLIGTAGNVSAPVPGSQLVAITATGVVLAECRPEQVSVVDRSGTVVEGELAPTSELDLHLAVLASTGGAIVHTHAPFATAVACVLDSLPVLHYQQLLLGGEIRVAPYATFGTPELAGHVLEALEGRSAALMANHGSVTHGSTLAQAVDHALLLEWCCQLFHRASALGDPRALGEEQQREVIMAALARSYGTTQPAGTGPDQEATS
ncbi:class II aldolase/adducin family protein [Nocardioides sp.]|uniref:class II aldolase/adducin family protein n=1 Tax=Nocardioides sp. TaxID=35761 RepID=UPI00273367D1|nr:class II aldolase/adducin family protein [Nocardioides sp.]MDP3894939.1 class II aldolase/adducin family protein [Nocardioides sp.]